ncbi:hypothetical protein [Nocardioides aequoreus]|nr:hypothetical protein [Nocardioides aequoreus]
MRAFRRLQERIQQQQQRIARLETELGRLTAQVDALERMLAERSGRP